MSRFIIFYFIASLLFYSTAQGKSKVPPDPGEKGKQTLIGIDSDNDGIRDDLQRLILLKVKPKNDLSRKGYFKLARALQDAIVNCKNEQEALKISKRASEALQCIFSQEGSKNSSSKIEAMVANTHARIKKYMAYNSFLSGHTFKVSSLDEMSSLCK